MKSADINNTTIIAVCGKGGVGKTSISAMIASIIAENPEKKVLAIDADPAVGLAMALGFPAQKTVDNIRSSLIARVKMGVRENMNQIAADLDYEVFEAIEEKNNIAFLAIGRPEEEGCYCQVNDCLREIIESISKNFDYVVLDAEAGIEQINRRVMENVSHLLLVSDQSVKGIAVAHNIMEVSLRLVKCRTCGIILNRVRPEERNPSAGTGGLSLLGILPEDECIRSFDIEGRSFLDLPECKARMALRNCLSVFGIQ